MSLVLEYWGLGEKAFDYTPNSRFFYASPEHKEALSRLSYAAWDKKPLAILTGEYGTGKTMVCSALKTSLPPESFRLVHIPNPLLSLEEILGEILRSLLEVPQVPSAKGEILQQLKEVLIRNFNVGKHTVLILDEAHLIEDISAFDELRMLLNYQYREQLLLSLIFVGQSDLRDKIHRLPAFRQRISLQFHLKPIPEADIGNYIQHRLTAAGCPTGRKVFEPDCFPVIYKHSKGLPRIINHICDLALLNGFQGGVSAIHLEILKSVFQEVPSYEETSAVF